MIFTKFLKVSRQIKSAVPKSLVNQIYLVYLCLIFTAFLEMLGLGSIPVFITFILDPNTTFEILNINISSLIKNIFKEKNFLVYFPLLIILIFLIKNLMMFLIMYLETRITRNVKIYFIKTLFKIYIYKPYDFYLNKNSAEIVKNIFNETQTTTTMVTSLLKFTREFTILIVIGILILIYEPLISFSAIFILGMFFIIFYYLFNNYILNLGKLRLKLLDFVFNGIQSLSGSIKDIKIYKKEKFFNDKFSKDVIKYENVIFKQSFLEKIPRIIFEILAVVIVFSTISIYFQFGGEVNRLIPILALFAISLVRLVPAFTSMSSALYYMRYVKTSFDHVTNQVINFKQNKYAETGLIRSFYDLKDKVASINNLHFNYSKNPEVKSISNMNFDIKKGEMIGIIGKSGAGKSTLINIILGLLEPKKGSVRFNELNKNTENLFSYVPQDIFLLDDTLKKNIAFGDDESLIKDKDINEIVELSGLTPLMKKNKQGTELIVGERGVRLSGGEKQRVGIARALYKRSEIMILDEATSSLDTVTEKQIIDSINKLKNKLTIIIVTHRLSTIKNCDKIFLIRQGMLIDSGSLDYLKSKYPDEFIKDTNDKF